MAATLLRCRNGRGLHHRHYPKHHCGEERKGAAFADTVWLGAPTLNKDDAPQSWQITRCGKQGCACIQLRCAMGPHSVIVIALPKAAV